MKKAQTPFFITIDDDKIDNLINNKVIKQAVPEADITTFSDPELGLSFIKEGLKEDPKSTILLLDINMPLLNGWGLLNELKDHCVQLRENMKVYMLSSSINPIDQKLAKENPLVHGYISKPLTKAKVEGILDCE